MRLSLTADISSNGGLHKYIHPFSHRFLAIGIKVKCPFTIMLGLETIFAAVDGFINDNAIATKIDNSFHAYILQGERGSDLSKGVYKRARFIS